MLPRKGAIAYCGQGFLGLILSDKPETIGYRDGNAGEAWTGIHLSGSWTTGEVPGRLWSSRNPIVVGFVDNPEEVKAAIEAIRKALT